MATMNFKVCGSMSMAVRMGRIEEFSFSIEDNAATACAGALRKVKSLNDLAPVGRLFESITTLADTAASINQSLTTNDLRKAAKQMHDYAAPSSIAEDLTPLPIHFRKRQK
jgi:hypothetical protein